MNGGGVFSPDRRAFLGRMTITVGGVACAALLPVSLLEAAQCSPARLVDYRDFHDACGDWQLDDMCSHYPPYAFRVPPAPAGAPHVMAHVADVDRNFIAS